MLEELCQKKKKKKKKEQKNTALTIISLLKITMKFKTRVEQSCGPIHFITFIFLSLDQNNIVYKK